MEDLFLYFGNLPLHPLSVHFAVALFPLAVMFLMLVTVWKKARDRFLSVAVLATILTLPLVYLAQQSGEALSEVLYEPQPHSQYGEQLMPLALATAAAGAVLWVSIKQNWNKIVSQIAGFAIVPLGIASLAMSFVVGHSGAEAVWAGKINPTIEQGQPIESPTNPDTSSTEPTANGIAASEVAKHNTAQDCWVVIDGGVYRLDTYMNQHPGGKAVLTNLCGQDASAAFASQHAQAALPAQELAKLKLGSLSGGSSAAQPSDGEQPGTAAPAPTKTISSTEVARHTSPSDCWTVVKDTVYNLSGYANEHPGGASQISALCGKDATAAFSAEHGFGGMPANVLAAMAVGTVEAGAPLPPTDVVYGDGDESEEHDD